VNKEKKWDIIQVYASSMFSNNLRFNPSAANNFDTTLNGLKIYGLNTFLECWVEKFIYTELDSFKIVKTPIFLIPHDTVNITINY